MSLPIEYLRERYARDEIDLDTFERELERSLKAKPKPPPPEPKVRIAPMRRGGKGFFWGLERGATMNARHIDDFMFGLLFIIAGATFIFFAVVALSLVFESL